MPSNLPNHPKWIWKAGWQLCWFAVTCHFSSHSFWMFLIDSHLHIYYMLFWYNMLMRGFCFQNRSTIQRNWDREAFARCKWYTGTLHLMVRKMWDENRPEKEKLEDRWPLKPYPSKDTGFHETIQGRGNCYLCFVQSNVLPYAAWHRRSAKSSTSPWKSSRRGGQIYSTLCSPKSVTLIADKGGAYFQFFSFSFLGCFSGKW